MVANMAYTGPGELKLDGNPYWLARQIHFSLSYERWMLNGMRYDEGVIRPVQ